MTKPIRVQLSRKKGWRMPENTVKVDRSTQWGNPWTIKGRMEFLKSEGIKDTFTKREKAENCVYNYRLWMVDGLRGRQTERNWLISQLFRLRGKNLACWCPLDEPCHADVLLELANKEPNP